jgi:hypothetical protein
MQKDIVDSLFGLSKEWRGFRGFSLRGPANIRGDWELVNLTHNLPKLFLSGNVIESCWERQGAASVVTNPVFGGMGSSSAERVAIASGRIDQNPMPTEKLPKNADLQSQANS